MTMLTISGLKKIFAEYGFRPLKRFGENYLVDGNIVAKIIAAVAPRRGEAILEIGPGLGALTVDLARSGARVIAVEKDPKAFAILQEIVGEDYPDLTLKQGDILDFDLAAAGAGKITVVGNLPYYATTPIIEYLIERRGRIRAAFITVQREVANRLLAVPGTKEYSSLSCFVQYYMKPAYIHTVKRDSFYPVPEVDSSFIRLDVLDTPSVAVRDEALLFTTIRGAFNQRRKSILNSLSREAVLDLPKERLAALLASIGIDPAARPETLTLHQFASIANAISA